MTTSAIICWGQGLCSCCGQKVPSTCTSIVLLWILVAMVLCDCLSPSTNSILATTVTLVHNGATWATSWTFFQPTLVGSKKLYVLPQTKCLSGQITCAHETRLSIYLDTGNRIAWLSATVGVTFFCEIKIPRVAFLVVKWSQYRKRAPNEKWLQLYTLEWTKSILYIP